MDVGSVQSQEELQRILQTQQTSTQGTGQKPPHPPDGMMPPMGDQVAMSDLAEMVQNGDLTEEDLEALHSFGMEIGDALKDGTFDASTLAEEAPEALQTLAESQGMTVEELITDMADKMSAFLADGPSGMPYGAPPPPPLEDSEEQEESEVVTNNTDETTVA